MLLAPLAAWAGDGRLEISQQLIPYTVTNSGSYVVTENLAGSVGSNGIIIAASDVTLDLNGFIVRGVPSSLSGIAVTGNRLNVIIKNGAVRSWGVNGISAQTASNSVAQDIQSSNNGQDGIVMGSGASVLGCNSINNGRDGITLQASSLAAGINVRANGRYGITATEFCLLDGVISRENNSTGIKVGQVCNVIQSSLRANRGAGIEIGVGGLVSDCSVLENASNGVVALNSGVKIQRLSAFGNGGFGVVGAAGTMVEGSAIRRNTNGGVRVQSYSFVTDNMLDQNQTGPGVLVSGVYSRVENNHATMNTVGFTISGSNNLVVLNSAVRNAPTNYLYSVTNNFYDTVVNPGSTDNNEDWGNYDVF